MEPVFADDSRDITPRTEMSPKDNPASDFKNGNSDKTESLNVPLVRDDDFAMPEDTQVVEKESTVSEFLDLPGKAYEQAGYWRDLALSAERAGLEPVIPSGSVDVVLFDAFSAKLSSEDEKKRLRSEVKKWLKKPVVREKFTAEDRELVLSAWKGKKGFGNQATVIALSEVTGITARLWLPRGPRLYKPSVPKDGLKVDVAIPGLGEYVAFQAKKASSSPRLVTRDVMFLESSTLLPGMESNSHSVSELHSDNAVKTRKLVEMSVDEAEFVFGSRPRQALKASIGTDEVLEFSKGEVFMKDGDYYLTPAQEERLHAYRSRKIASFFLVKWKFLNLSSGLVAFQEGRSCPCAKITTGLLLERWVACWPFLCVGSRLVRPVWMCYRPEFSSLQSNIFYWRTCVGFTRSAWRLLVSESCAVLKHSALNIL